MPWPNAYPTLSEGLEKIRTAYFMNGPIWAPKIPDSFLIKFHASNLNPSFDVSNSS